MAYFIQDDCIACGACQSECPVEAISEGDIYVIDPDKCIDCGACADVCPTGAPNPEDSCSGLPRGHSGADCLSQ